MTSTRATGGTGGGKDNGGGGKDETRPYDEVVATRFMCPANEVVPAIFPKFLYRDSWLMLHRLCR
ncbi:hypothetical protein E2C01_091040 [Portunus trituberculatus]|uniref:Uncharacterized protein n=1 Tax=Portunus trituberculatus TaxID=210409 RepID=A0A5B7JN01_PORTR|nr:hypothetical protein [Portunus trituberculatus]